jgi:hypothetical protein
LVWLAGKEFLGSEPWKRWWINFVFLTWENGKRMTRSLLRWRRRVKDISHACTIVDANHTKQTSKGGMSKARHIVSVFCPRLWALKSWAKIEKRGKNRKYLGYTIK